MYRKQNLSQCHFVQQVPQTWDLNPDFRLTHSAAPHGIRKWRFIVSLFVRLGGVIYCYSNSASYLQEIWLGEGLANRLKQVCSL